MEEGRQGWDAQCLSGNFVIFNLEWWFSWEVQDFLQLVLRSGGHIENQWLDVVTESMISHMFCPEVSQSYPLMPSNGSQLYDGLIRPQSLSSGMHFAPYAHGAAGSLKTGPDLGHNLCQLFFIHLPLDTSQGKLHVFSAADVTIEHGHSLALCEVCGADWMASEANRTSLISP